MFQRNSFYQYSDESVDEKNRLLLTTECHNKRDNLDFPFIVSYLLRMSHLKAYTLTLENDVSHFTFKGSQHPKVLL